ncbi:MAG: hypothetical protein WCO84_07100 [bacterium]
MSKKDLLRCNLGAVDSALEHLRKEFCIADSYLDYSISEVIHNLESIKRELEIVMESL